MGSDDLFRRRKARTQWELRRRQARREPYDRVLIVCEGARTEPHYFKELRTALGLSNANIEVTGEGGTAPLSVVQTAIDLFHASPEYDRVFCVFDQDTHTTYQAAIDKIDATLLHKRIGRSSAGRAVFQSIPSVPCFEYWLLLHYEETARPFVAAGDRSACQEVIHALKRHMPDYAKGGPGLYKKTAPLLGQAIPRAQRILYAAETGGTDNPTTRIHELVEYLFSLAKQRR